MDITKLLKERKSVRSFLNKEVEEKKIESILKATKYTPSGSNMQPWIIHIVSGQTKRLIDKKVLEAFDFGIEAKMDYSYYPEKIPDLYQNRRRETGLQLFKSINIQRDDKKRRKEQWRANYDAFGAPTVIYFFMNSKLTTGSYIDMGMIIQSTLMLAQEQGLATCVMASLAEYPNIVREVLNIDNSELLICGVALGYENKSAKINSYRTPRLNINEFTTFHN